METMDEYDATHNYGVPAGTPPDNSWQCWECKRSVRHYHPEDHALECPQHISLGEQEFRAQKVWDEWVGDSMPKGGYI